MKKILLYLTFFMFATHVHGQIIRHEFTDNYELNIGKLECRMTTEDGSDEVYMFILYKYGSGESGYTTAPVEHWSMYRDQIIIPGNVFTFTLRGTESIDILCILMEEDDFSPRSVMADEILTRVNAKDERLLDISYYDIELAYQMWMFPNIGWPYNSNDDDFIGAFVLNVTPGGFITSFSKVQTIDQPIIFAIEETKPFTFFLDGDGSFYEGYISIK